MKLDYRTRIVIAETKAELKAELDYDISEEEITNVYQSQFKAAKMAMAKGLDFKLYKLARFKRSYKVIQYSTVFDLRQLKGLIDVKTYRGLFKEFSLQHKAWLKRVEKSKKQISIEEFNDCPNVHGNTMYAKERKVKPKEEIEYEYL